MNIQKFQTYIDLTVANWENTSMADTLREIVRSQRQYENDYVEIHQLIEIFKSDEESDFTIIINISRDLDDLGELIG
ncbi:hypothetical protein ACFSGI_21395 [Paenibacillus nicotianae]|uniref:Uncharacterized protein n=1 Tax=Paenibacillus nicotianae TaxID=1526551 RepID=A0ABW4UZ97_9BACL